LKQKIADILEVEMVSLSKDMDSQDKTASNLRQELDVLRKKAVGSERTTRAMTDLIQLNRNGKINLSVEIKVLEEEVTHSKNQIRALLMDKEKFEHDAEVANQQYYTALEELKLQELQVQELNKKISTDQVLVF
jgi:chromosome segregation ATPase